MRIDQSLAKMLDDFSKRNNVEKTQASKEFAKQLQKLHGKNIRRDLTF